MWGADETGVSVAFGARAGRSRKKVKPPKPKKRAEASSDRPSMPGLPPVRPSQPRDSLLAARPAVPIGVPIVHAPMRGTTTGSQTGIHSMRRSTKLQGGHPVLRSLAVTFIVIMVAGGGFAAGALTELGTEAELFVLGPTPPPPPAIDPRVPTLEAELARAQDALAAEREVTGELRAAAARPADTTVERAARKDSKNKSRHGKKHRRGKSDGRVDL